MSTAEVLAATVDIADRRRPPDISRVDCIHSQSLTDHTMFPGLGRVILAMQLPATCLLQESQREGARALQAHC